MRNAGLLSQETRGDRLVTVASPIQQGFPTWQAVTAPAFAAFLRRISLASTRDLLDDNVESGGAEDLAFAVALLFSMPNPLQPIASFEPGAEKTLADYQTEQFGDDIGNWIVRNGERYAPLLRWVTYLGFGRILNLGRGRSGLLLVDPSEALRHLAVPLLDSQTRIADFLVRLGSAMPYSDQGGIGASLRGRLREEPTDDSLSPGLALGLQVLYLRKELQLTLLSDAESMAFPIDVGRVLRYSHIGPGSSQ
jgi:hypothetical protein